MFSASHHRQEPGSQEPSCHLAHNDPPGRVPHPALRPSTPPLRPSITRPSVHHASVHPSAGGGAQHGPPDGGRQRADSPLTSAPLPELFKGTVGTSECPANSILVVDKAGAPSVSIMGTAALLRCRVPAVLQGRRCLVHHPGTKA
ncbi:unnamed protein product [Lota lota]